MLSELKMQFLKNSFSLGFGGEEPELMLGISLMTNYISCVTVGGIFLEVSHVKSYTQIN